MTATPNLKHITQLIEKQATTTAALTQATTFREIVGIIAQHMLVNPGLFVSINMTEYNEAGEIKRLRTVASANRNESFDIESSVDLVEAELGDDGGHLSGHLHSTRSIADAPLHLREDLRQVQSAQGKRLYQCAGIE